MVVQNQKVPIVVTSCKYVVVAVVSFVALLLPLLMVTLLTESAETRNVVVVMAFSIRTPMLSRCYSNTATAPSTPSSYGIASRLRLYSTSPVTPNSNNNSFKVSATSLEKNLVSDQEKAIVRVARTSQPSIAFITSVLIPASITNNNSNDNKHSSRSNNSPSTTTTTLPRDASPLGSGSAFVIDSRGHIVTNYHVIEMAYEIQQQQKFVQSFYNNVTSSLPTISCPWFNTSVTNTNNLASMFTPTAQVYVRIDSPTKYQLCRIVAVHPEIDVAIVQVINEHPEETKTFQSLQFGRSAQLLVGQTVIAIGNPFGYDTTVTTGVVSALNREIRLSDTSSSRRFRRMMIPTERMVVRNCIQTDCAINPGNSGGPLLNLYGNVVGINTAIITTSGSNSGIGFAISSDIVQEVISNDIQKDALVQQQHSREKSNRNNTTGLRQRGILGIKLLKTTLGSTFPTDVENDDDHTTRPPPKYCWIANVLPNSVADQAGLKGIRRMSRNSSSFSSTSSTLSQSSYYEDAIVAINGQTVTTYQEIYPLLSNRIIGEQITLTIYNDQTKEKRIVYITVK